MPGILTPYINVGKHFSDIYSVWGITWRAVYDDTNPFTTIEEWARFNLEQIKRHSPGKRINLIGHSYGNIIVYEMAKQLTEAGQSVGDVFLIDGAPDFLSKKYSPLQKIELFLQSINTEGQFSQQQIKQLTKQLERVNPKDIPQAIAVMLDKQGIGSEANKRLIKKAYEIYDPAMSLQYKPTSELPLKAVVLRARDSKFYKGKLKDMGWKKYFETIKTDYVDGDHFSVVNGDYTRIVTESTFI
jgi:thioesterase domain-containing protein